MKIIAGFNPMFRSVCSDRLLEKKKKEIKNEKLFFFSLMTLTHHSRSQESTCVFEMFPFSVCIQDGYAVAEGLACPFQLGPIIMTKQSASEQSSTSEFGFIIIVCSSMASGFLLWSVCFAKLVPTTQHKRCKCCFKEK